MSLLLPAVNSVRESMRRAQCKNSLAQLGKAAQAHLAAQGHFPSSGWGFLWTGEPDHGFGAKQPGGWVYNLLPYLGLDMIHDLGKGASGSDRYNKYLVEAKSAAIPFLICSTRRKPIAYPAVENARNAANAATLNKTDYAANGGSVCFLGAGPTYDSSNYTCSCFSTYPNCAWSNPDQSAFNGVSGERSEVPAGQIVDGLSNVFFAGEKYLAPDNYYTGSDGADNDSCLEGNDWDVNRWVSSGFPPMRDTRGVFDCNPSNSAACSQGFGSAHPAGVQFVFCDGAVKLLAYQIDTKTYQSLGVRNDGTYSENF
jgi:hypothetical protein